MTSSIREKMIWTVMRIILLGTTDSSIIQINPPSEREYSGITIKRIFNLITTTNGREKIIQKT